jgi:hypothetical protein
VVSAFVPGVSLITLADGVPYNKSGVSCPVGEIDYYLYTVSATAVRAQFEVLSPSEDVNLIVRKGLPLPTLANFAYQSTNSSTSDELITIFNNSAPPLTPGDWYLGVVRTSVNPVTYSVKVTEFTTPGTNLVITSISPVAGSLCIAWTNALPGVHYFVQGKTNLSDPAWAPVSPTITAISTATNYCIPLPTGYQMFRIAQGLATGTSARPFGGGSAFALKLTKVFGTASLNWSAPPGQKFTVQWSSSISPASWTAFPGVVTSSNTTFTFSDDGSQTGGLKSPRFYQIVPVP